MRYVVNERVLCTGAPRVPQGIGVVVKGNEEDDPWVHFRHENGCVYNVGPEHLTRYETVHVPVPRFVDELEPIFNVETGKQFTDREMADMRERVGLPRSINDPLPPAPVPAPLDVEEINAHDLLLVIEEASFQADEYNRAAALAVYKMLRERGIIRSNT